MIAPLLPNYGPRDGSRIFQRGELTAHDHDKGEGAGGGHAPPAQSAEVLPLAFVANNIRMDQIFAEIT